eukprot:TRINITY_DN14683_c0_g1_i1.p1 TRINITY_DN14683_c0_g1~~TRINITY_DN14683_c0_g1_i1.p1  ORF type:complete len:114 (-),score=2.84 TRINITY_DN14683_c0_g1_i1:17-358(-)
MCIRDRYFIDPTRFSASNFRQIINFNSKSLLIMFRRTFHKMSVIPRANGNPELQFASKPHYHERLHGTNTLHTTESIHDTLLSTCLLYTSDAADEEDSVDLGGRVLIKKIKIE